MALGLRDERVGDVEHEGGHRPSRVAQVHPQQRGDLVVAAAPGPQPPTELGPGALDEAALEGGVHVLVVRPGRECAGRDVGVETAQCLEHRVELAGA